MKLTRFALCISLVVCSPATVVAAGTTLRIVSVPIEAAADIYYAQDQGFFKDAGLDVQVDELSAGQNIVAAVAAGSYDIGTITTVALVNALQHGVAVHMIAPGPMHVSSASTDLLMVMQTSPFRSAKDLDGKTIAVTGLGNVPFLSLQAWLRKNGADVGSIKFVEMPFPTMGAALQVGRVDAAMLSEPYVTSDRAFARTFANTFDAIAPRFMLGGWFSSDAWLQQHPDLAKRFIEAMRKAHEWCAAHPSETAAIVVRHTRLTAEVIAHMTRATFGTTLDPATLQPVIDAALASGMLPRATAASDVIWNPAP